jgi:hypothetical protein
MLCQMLHHGGMKVAGYWPMFEYPTQCDDPAGEWILGYEAVKVLEPATDTPRAGDYRCIWLDRDQKQQAKSWAKWYRVKHGGSDNRAHRKHALIELRRDRAKHLAATRRLSSVPPLMMRFESILREPGAAARALCDFVGRELDEDRMVAGVLRRGPECQPQVLEDTLSQLTLGG